MHAETAEGLRRWVRAGLATAVVDGLFSGVLAAVFYGSTVARLFQGVAATLLGSGAMSGGTRTMLVGLLMHFGVAFTWSAVFWLLLLNVRWARDLLARPFGVLKIASLYGPFIWCVMSLIVIPLLVQRPPAITYRWWVQFFGHVPFVAVPMAWSFAGYRPRATAPNTFVSS